MESALLLDVVVRKSSSIFQLLSSKDQPLLVWGDALLVLDLGLDILNGVGRLHLQGDGLPGQCLDENLHTSSQPENQVKGGLLLDVVVRKSSSIFQLLSSKDKPLLVRGDALLVLDLGLDILNGVRRLHLQGDGLPGQRLDEDLHTSSQPQHKMEGGLLLDVVVRESSSIFQLLSSKDQPLLVWGVALLVLDFGLDILNRVRRLHLQRDGLASQGLHKDLHSSSQSQHKMEGRLLLDVVDRKSSSILQLLASKDQPLLVWGDSLLVLNLCLDILNGVRRLHLQSDGLASQGLHKDLHFPNQSQNKMEGRLLLDVVVRKSSSILKLLSSKDQPLLVWWDALLVLNLGLDILNGVRWLNLQGDGLASEGLDKDLHTTSQSEHKMKSALLLDVVVRKSSSILKLLASKDEPLLVWGDSLLVLDLGLDILNRVRGLHL